MMSRPSVLVNIVLYNPDKNKIVDLINICSQYQNAKIFLFDNTENSEPLELDHAKPIILFQSPQNAGVGGVHYRACQMAEKEKFDFVLFLDQDSQLPLGFISDMVSGFYQLRKLYPRLCAIGPTWSDPELGRQRIRKLKDKLRALLKAPNLKH